MRKMSDKMFTAVVISALLALLGGPGFSHLGHKTNGSEVRGVSTLLRSHGCPFLAVRSSRMLMRRTYQLKRPSLLRVKEFSEGLPSFGRVLREKREAKKMTIRGTGEASGMGASDWSYIEHGRIWPQEKYYDFLATFLDTSPAMLRQDIKRIQHEQELWMKKYQDVTDWLKKMGENSAAVRTLVLR